MSNENFTSNLENNEQKVVKNESIETTTGPAKTDLLENLSNKEDKETADNDWEYLKLYERQNKVAQQLQKRAEENNLRDINGEKLSFSPEKLEFDWDVIIYNSPRLSDLPHLFIMENKSFKEIQLLPEKIYPIDRQWNWVIPRNIKKIKDGVYCVELVHLKNNWVEQRWGIWDAYLWDYNESYFIDKTGKVLDQIWKLWNFVEKDGIYSRHNRQHASLWFRQTEFSKYDFKWKLQSKSLTIFDKNLHKLFTIENSQQYRVQYCDDQVCICQDTKEYFTKKYIIVDKTWIIAQWSEDELKSNEHMQKFLEVEEQRQKIRKESGDKERKKRKLPFGERFKEINHCIILQDKERQTAIIQNDKWKVLYEIWDVLDFYEDDYNPEFRTRDWNLRMAARNKDSNILLVQKYEGGYHKKSIFINKTTWEKLEFDWIKWVYSFLHEKLIEVFVNWYDSEIYDENLDKLWTRIWSGYGLYAVARQENWETKAYLYNSNTWEQLCEIENGHSNKTIKRFYSGDDWKHHLIIEKKDWTLIEVSP